MMLELDYLNIKTVYVFSLSNDACCTGGSRGLGNLPYWIGGLMRSAAAAE